ncbi:putative membrane protein [Protomyces lactucae-debilis]|uniref:Putative membrane protein n=1 Tax=Protomyces lactucae-debilis TaxID=2754530 RepID=A0A1Y2FVF4_PROLT|nr:uncharacterized protein BCR37DRAFT_363762 [Protomyces lactucae-debilis]ORY87980.1 putative membrane protein [Protomyces lactucae-debilis]
MSSSAGLRSRSSKSSVKASSTIDVSAKDKLKSTLLAFDDLLDWQRDSHFIKRGYRPASNSFRKSFASVCAVHNETVNIWTHLVPGFLFGDVLKSDWSWKALSVHYASATKTDLTMWLIFFTGAFLMFTGSWTYHTVSNHSHAINKMWNKADYAGIVCMILGSFFPSVYYGHYCDPHLIQFYLSLLSGFGFLTLCVTLMDRFRTPLWRPFRAGMFIVLGLSALIPVVAAVLEKGLTTVSRDMSLFETGLQGILYITGAVIYACRVPERFFPGRFDILGASHQIFHVFVVLAGVSHFIGLLKAFDYRHGVLQGQCHY